MEIKNLIQGRGVYKQEKLERADTEAKGRTKAQSKEGEACESDVVMLSEEARLRGQALQVASLDSGLRQERIQDIKERIRNGTYEPDLRKVAENILREDLDLFV